MSKRKLLLADDSVTIQKVVNLTFADEGIEVISVGDGDSAMNKISEMIPDVVLADVHMPGLNGYQICERLRQNPSTRELPVVLLVGSFEPFDEAEAERVGANAYLTKPFQSIRQLVSQVSDLMESRSSVAEETVAEFVPEQPLPDTSDIDSLYQSSFEETEPERDEAETGPPRYVDAGMDDEMIETAHVDEGVDSDARTDESLEIPAMEEPVEEPTYARAAVSATSSPFDSPATETESGPVWVESEPETSVDQFAQTEQIPSPVHQPTHDNFDLDEVELLDLPPIDDGRTLEFTTTEDLHARGGRKEVVSLSPELMDIIVQKVVDKLSEKY